MAEAGKGPGSGRLAEEDIEQDPATAAQKLSAAIEQEPNDAEYYCQRAYAYILLQNYHDAIADTKKALALDPNNSIAFLRQGIGEYYMKNYASALKFLNEGQKLNNADTSFTVWIKRCEETMSVTAESCDWFELEAVRREANKVVLLGSRMSQELDSRQHQSRTFNIKYDWYQTESHVIVTIMIKNRKKDEVSVQFSEKELNALVKLSSEEDYNLKLQLLHPIIPEQSSFRILSTKGSYMMSSEEFPLITFEKGLDTMKIEIKMKKPEAIRWEKLEGDGRSKPKQFSPVSDAALLYPSSSHYTRNWDKLVGEIKEEEKNEKLEGDAALNKLFQQIYSDGTDEVKRAMNKSFMESGGTVLSTNWSDVGRRKVEVNPPDDMEWKKF